MSSSGDSRSSGDRGRRGQGRGDGRSNSQGGRGRGSNSGGSGGRGGGSGRRRDSSGGRQGPGRPGSRGSGPDRPDLSGRDPDGSRDSGKPKRIPAPPERRPKPEAGAGNEAEEREFRIERLDDGKPGQRRGKSGDKKRSRRRNNRVYVDDVEMGNLAPATANKLRNRLSDAATAFEAERFSEAERLLLSIQRLAPDVAEVHELLGLCYYRLGHWRKAISELGRFHELTRSVEQHPVLADCHRAMKNWHKAEELWLELGAASPTPEIIEEGRIVQAGILADRGNVGEAIRFLEKAPKVKGRPGVHHLRRWYATADLYERAGDNSRARRLFIDIANADPGFGDAAERAASL